MKRKIKPRLAYKKRFKDKIQEAYKWIFNSALVLFVISIIIPSAKDIDIWVGIASLLLAITGLVVFIYSKLPFWIFNKYRNNNKKIRILNNIHSQQADFDRQVLINQMLYSEVRNFILDDCYLKGLKFIPEPNIGYRPNFSKSNFASSILDECEFTRIIFDFSDFRFSKIRNSTFFSVHLVSCCFQNSDLSNSKFYSVNFTDSEFIKCDLIKMTIRGNKISDSSYYVKRLLFKECNLTDCSIEELSIRLSSFNSVIFNNAIISCNFSDCIFEKCNFLNSKLKLINFGTCKFDNCIFDTDQIDDPEWVSFTTRNDIFCPIFE
jgi:uncharacterized protein YjbI with pentapeptide repeats